MTAHKPMDGESSDGEVATAEVGGSENAAGNAEMAVALGTDRGSTVSAGVALGENADDGVGKVSVERLRPGFDCRCDVLLEGHCWI